MVFDYENAECVKQLRVKQAKLEREKKQKEKELYNLCPCHFVRETDFYQEKKQAVEELRDKITEIKKEIVTKEHPHAGNRGYFSNRRSLKVPLERRHPNIRV